MKLMVFVLVEQYAVALRWMRPSATLSTYTMASLMTPSAASGKNLLYPQAALPCVTPVARGTAAGIDYVDPVGP